MEQNKELQQLREEVAGMRSDMADLKALIKEEKAKNKAAKPPMPDNPKVTKEECAAILLCCGRHLQRKRKAWGLRWKKVGRETHYYIKEIVWAIQKHQLPWSQKAYEAALARITKLPVL